jgi:hypothetical protein
MSDIHASRAFAQAAYLNAKERRKTLEWSLRLALQDEAAAREVVLQLSRPPIDFLRFSWAGFSMLWRNRRA